MRIISGAYTNNGEEGVPNRFLRIHTEDEENRPVEFLIDSFSDGRLFVCVARECSYDEATLADIPAKDLPAIFRYLMGRCSKERIEES